MCCPYQFIGKDKVVVQPAVDTSAGGGMLTALGLTDGICGHAPSLSEQSLIRSRVPT